MIMGTNQSPPKTGDAFKAADDSATKTGSAVQGASLLIVLQIASRAVTFVANQLLLRFLTAKLLGVSTQLEVYYVSVLFFARESLRVAIQRQGSPSSSSSKTPSDATNPRDSQSVVNIANISLALGLGTSVVLGSAYLYYVDAETAATPYLNTALRIYGLAALVELLSEPAFMVLQYRLRFGPRAAAESIATFLRCLVTFGAANWAWRKDLDFGALPFALGQLAYGVGLLGVYTWYGSRLASAEGFSLFPQQVSPDKKVKEKPSDDYFLGYFFKATVHLAWSMMAQSVVKHILTQGDTFLVSILSDPESQGIYAFASNYGSLLARLVFQPIEESSRNYFSKLLSSTSKNHSPEKQATVKAKTDLQALLKFYVLLSIVVVTVGPFAAPLLVQIVAGSRWSASGAGGVLAQYCMYIPFLAINGITEAFVSSVATKSEVHQQSLWMGAFSIAFGIAGFVTLWVLDLGAAGLVYANSINMLCRIIWSGTFISRYFKLHGVDFSWGGIVPEAHVALVISVAVMWSAFTGISSSADGISPHVFRDLLMVGSVSVPWVGIMAYSERRYLMECYRSIRGRRGAS
ncbi:Rft-1-domain-containing protein [Xylariaceae sp. FL0016]|nr:Rft-1-domain-containing protein [Xylariaceae sp. FL0016]